MATKAPVIGRMPAEITLQAQQLGLHVEMYTEVVAGHGPTGNVAWSVFHVVEHNDWADTVSLRSGTASTHEHARADLRHALEEITGQVS